MQTKKLTNKIIRIFSLLPLFLLLFFSETGLAHVESSAAAGDAGFVSGLLHPVTGLDHVVAMVAVGLWGAILGAPAIWLLPITFPLVMAVGAVLGVTGVPLPAVEVGVALSGIVLGLMVVFNVRAPLIVAFVVVAFFAIYHGHTHGTEIPEYGAPILFAAGFVISTGLLHVSGILLGLLFRWQAGQVLVRTTGAAIAATGLYYFVAAL